MNVCHRVVKIEISDNSISVLELKICWGGLVYVFVCWDMKFFLKENIWFYKLRNNAMRNKAHLSMKK